MSLAAVSCSTNFTNQLALSLTVIEDRLRFGKKISLLYSRPLSRGSKCSPLNLHYLYVAMLREDTHARKSPNKFGFSLA
jgi:hypothetical protein